MEGIAYYNGEFLPISEAKISITNRAVFFGDAVYDAAIGRNGRIFALDEHIDRLFESAKVLKIAIPHTKSELHEIITEFVAKVDADEQRKSQYR